MYCRWLGVRPLFENGTTRRVYCALLHTNPLASFQMAAVSNLSVLTQIWTFCDHVGGNTSKCSNMLPLAHYSTHNCTTIKSVEGKQKNENSNTLSRSLSNRSYYSFEDRKSKLVRHCAQQPSGNSETRHTS